MCWTTYTPLLLLLVCGKLFHLKMICGANTCMQYEYAILMGLMENRELFKFSLFFLDRSSRSR